MSTSRKRPVRTGTRGGQSPQRRRRGSAGRPRRRPLWKRLTRLVFVLSLLTALPLGAAVLHKAQSITLPPPGTVPGETQRVDILTSDGTLIASRGATTRYVPINLLPRHLIDAVLATEDRRFYYHVGVDPIGLARAVFINWRACTVVQGGSTITQQLAKNLLLSGERTLARKGQEFVLAQLLEALLSKQRILEIYLNSVEWGEGVFGAEAAAQHYYRKSAAKLSPWEAARLAVMLPAPKRFEKMPASGYLSSRAATITARMGDAVLP